MSTTGIEFLYSRMRKIHKIEEELQEIKRPLRIQGLMKKRKETVDEFLVKFFTKWNSEYDTVYADTKKEVREVQTPKNKRRSLSDIYQIVRYYYPDATLEDIAKFLYKDAKEEVPRFRSSMCSMINRRVFYQGAANQNTEFYDKSKKDEHNMDYEQWKRQVAK